MAFLTLMAAYPASSLADTQVSGIICSDTTWTSSGSPYVIDTQVQVAYGATLTIDPGVEVSGGVLGVWGTLAATGTSDAPIYLNAVSVELGSATRDEPGDIELSHCLVDGGGVGIGSGYGTLSLSDSVCVDMAQLDAYYPTSDWYLEDNVFRNCSGIWTWTNSYEPVSYGNVYILNNVFYDATAPIENVISGGTSFTQVTGNTFDPPDAGQTTIALELEPYLPNAAMEAEGNYWGTADSAAIAARIYDESVDLNCGGYISFTPFLTAPDPGTPALITGFTTASGPVGSTVTLNGCDFTGATAVIFNGVAASSFAVDSDTQITATVPTGATSGPISVTTAAGTATSTGNFTVIPAPTLATFTPTSGPVQTVVTLSGTGFTFANAVSLNGVTVPFTVLSDTEITATVPCGASSGLIAVSTPGGSAASTTNFTVLSNDDTLSALTVSAGTLSSDFSPTNYSYLDSVANSVESITVTPTTDNAEASYVLKVGGTTVSNPIALSVGATTIEVVVSAQNGDQQSYAVKVTRAAPLVTPRLTLRLSGLTSGALKLGKRLTAKGTVSPASLSGNKVVLTLQRKQGSTWVKVTTLTRTINSSGVYSGNYKPAKRGSYRMEATVLKTAANTAVTTAWRTFKVK